MLPIALMIASASARAQVVGADGENGADCFTGGCAGGNGADGQSVTASGSAFGGVEAAVQRKRLGICLCGPVPSALAAMAAMVEQQVRLVRTLLL